MQDKVMLSMESRMRGDMQVRFGGRYEETYCRKAARRLVPSLRMGKGGNIIALAEHLYASDHLPYLLNRIEQQTPWLRPVSFSFGWQSSSEPCFQQLNITPLSSSALLDYLQERGINTALAKRECREARFTHNGKRYFAIAFPNLSGGYEIRNRYFKGCIAPKAISHIRQSGEQRSACYVFEGFIDYLSFLTLRFERCPDMPELDAQDYMVLNSTANVPKALYSLGGYERIHCFLDNDRAGMEALQQIRREYAGTRQIRDASHIYGGCKDLNEYLCLQRQPSQRQTPKSDRQRVQTQCLPRKKSRGL
ncbi:toprim domain-containing protein [Alistipes sp.]|uniref:toprim domain-containing protein n=1 Tax=Alistipes sp. TaxID=1872444 RepID=UPI0025C07524|nr:toprim domain-containing protein [Alistipes sp.]